jgi:ribosomal protein L40E
MKLNDKFKAAFTTVNTKTKDTIEAQKVKSLISKQKQTINALYNKLGQDYIAKYANNYDESMLDDIKKIQNAQEIIAENEIILAGLEGYTFCPSCNSKEPKSATYCSHCGSLIQVEEVVEGEVIEDLTAINIE